MEIEEISACIQAIKLSNNGTMSTEVISAFIKSLKQSNEKKMAENRRSKKQGPFERPTFRAAGLDELLAGAEQEASEMVRLYRL